MNKQRLAAKIWESANKMRSKIEANEYKDYILGFIFYKFLSDKELKYLRENDWEDEEIRSDLNEEDGEALENIKNNIGYFIAYKDLFSTWLERGSDFNVSDVSDALNAFNRHISPSHKRVFEKIFDTLQTGLSKLGDSSGSRTKAIRDLLYLIKDIPMDGRQDYDVLGFIYEYLISNFAANAGKKAGEFYTPQEVSLLMSEIVADHLRDRKEIKIYDPTSGSGSLLINIGKCAAQYLGTGDTIKYYAQENKENTYNLTRMNLVMRGIEPANIVTRNGDTLEEDWPYFEDTDPVGTYDPLYVDAVVSNPPYSQNWNPADKEADPRYRAYGLAPKSKADYAFLLHDLYHVQPDGIMTIVLPHGVLFRGGEEGNIRKNLIENNKIDAIIGLPANIFFGTGIPTIIMILKQKRPSTDVLIIDASKGFAKKGKSNILRACDIKKIVDVVRGRSSLERYSRLVSREEIRSNDYNLNIPRYVDSSEKSESWDIYATMYGGIPRSEVEDLAVYWEAFPGLKEALFAEPDQNYLRFKLEDVKGALAEHPMVKKYRCDFERAFADFDAFVSRSLIDEMQTINIHQGKSVIAGEIFKRLRDFPLVDAYDAYQLLDEEWKHIEVDLEMIQTEGFEACKKVEPHMVVKKSNGNEKEVQDGWVGRVIPFELVQEKLLSEPLSELQKLETRALEIPAEVDALLEELPEEEKDNTFINEDKSNFVPAEVKRVIRMKDAEPDILCLLKRYDALATEEKTLRKQIKDLSIKLQSQSIACIQSLSDEQVIELLKAKWILPLTSGIAKLPNEIINGLAGKLNSLANKYATTFAEVETQIRETEQCLSSLLDELCGNEFDLRGLSEFKRLLGGEGND